MVVVAKELEDANRVQSGRRYLMNARSAASARQEARRADEGRCGWLERRSRFTGYDASNCHPTIIAVRLPEYSQYRSIVHCRDTALIAAQLTYCAIQRTAGKDSKQGVASFYFLKKSVAEHAH